MTVLPFRSLEDVESAICTVEQHLGSGGLLAYPTETVYGLGSRARDEDLARLAVLKGRSEDKPFLLLVSSREMAVSYGLVFTAAADALADRFWPGPLTLVLLGSEGKLPDTLRGPEGGIAVRWTSHSETAALVARLGQPLSSTSANLPGEKTVPGVDALVTAFGPAVEEGRLLVLDGGVLGYVPPSTVIDCTSTAPSLIREGAILRSELRRRAGRFAP